MTSTNLAIHNTNDSMQTSIFESNTFYKKKEKQCTPESYILLEKKQKSNNNILLKKEFKEVSEEENYSFCYENTLAYEVIETMRQVKLSELKTYPSIEAESKISDLKSEIWFTPFLMLIFVLYGFSLASNKKSLINEIKYIFLPNTISSSYEHEGDNGFQNFFVLFILSVVSISLFSFFSVQIYHDYLFQNIELKIATFLGIILLYSILKLFFLRLVCFVFYDYSIQIKVTKLYLLVNSLIGLGLIPSVLLLAYSPTEYSQVAVYIGLFVYFSLIIAYLQKIISFFFVGSVSIFYLILYLCTVEIIPIIGLILGLVNVY